VGKALNKWFGFYENYFAKMRPAVEQENPEQPEQPAEPAQASEQAQASAEQAAAEEITE